MQISLHELLVICQQKLGEHAYKRYWQDLLILLSFFLNKQLSLDEMVTNRNQLVQINLKAFLRSLKKIVNGTPTARIVGYLWWGDLKVKVNRGVFIPRVETLVLVNIARDLINQENLAKATMLDLCCGTGCISLAIKKQFPEINCVLVDCSKKALKNAQSNFGAHMFSATYLHSNFLKEVFKQNINPAIIVCNPPYLIKSKCTRIKNDPKKALYAREQGLYFYRVLFQSLKHFNAWPKVVILEIDPSIKNGVNNLFINEHLPYSLNLTNDVYEAARAVWLVYHQK